jgi:prepilin-type N-terminal cleavage/methylation domain-containing protein
MIQPAHITNEGWPGPTGRVASATRGSRTDVRLSGNPRIDIVVQASRLQPVRARAPRGFTLIELLVAISVSVILLTVLAFVLRISVSTMRDANSRTSMTERLRNMNIRLRSEVGGMLPVVRANNATYQISDSNGQSNNVLTFASTTTAAGRNVSLDVRYEFIPDAVRPENSRLVRYRDKTGPYDLVNQDTINPLFTLGDDTFAPETLADVVITNVRAVTFEVITPPPPANTTNELNPRVLPQAIKLTITYGPDMGDPQAIENGVFYFPVYRGS